MFFNESEELAEEIRISKPRNARNLACGIRIIAPPLLADHVLRKPTIISVF